ncbi:hypothetical protein GTN30_06395 [Macrococcoides canis]|uniref:Uncharacterized protein n=1 Tax=Macrococcoides canis TaxID=1855823 RepID=A0AAE7BZZ9_9STAP|nr:hypothetical protein [Macrococcus canis]QIH78297.1 hypothetical protein GTN30_06395 [Macrococcus canis]
MTIKMNYVIINGKYLSGRFELFSDESNYYLFFAQDNLLELFKDFVVRETTVTTFIDETNSSNRINLLNEVFEGSSIKFTEFIGLDDGYAIKIEYVKKHSLNRGCFLMQ